MPAPGGGGETRPGELSPTGDAVVATGGTYMTVVRNDTNRKEVSAVAVSTVWTTLLEISPNNHPATFFVWDDGSNEKSSHLRFDYSYDGIRWCTSINGTAASIIKGANTSVCLTPLDYSNDDYVYAPHYRLVAKKITSQESMNASAWWPDNR